MDRSVSRLHITLDPEDAARLARLARLARVPESELARLLLSKAIDEVDPDERRVTVILDGIPGAYEHALQNLVRAREGEATIALEDL